MRPPIRAPTDREALAAHVRHRCDAADMQVGVFLAWPTGPTKLDVIVERDADRAYPSASVIKLVVLSTLYHEHQGNLDALDEPCPIRPENRVGGSGLLHLLDAPEPSLRDLARAMIVISDNAATNELIDYLGTASINAVATELGLNRTRLGRKMMTTVGGDRPDDPVNTTSPRDCARLFTVLLHGEMLSRRAREEQLEILRNQKLQSLFPRYASNDVELAHKTGRLPGTALDTGLVESVGDPPLFFAVFCEGAATRGDASDLIAEIGDATLAWLTADRE